jgi:curved DNA-binding protein CbpA
VFMVDLQSDSYYVLLGVEPNATAAEIRQARDRQVWELRERQRREPINRRELIERQKTVNAAGEELARPAKREKYDKEHAHLRFFTVRNAAAPMFIDKGDRLYVLRRALAAHLAAAGTPLRQLSDLDRVDFSGDLTYNPLLDGQPS